MRAFYVSMLGCLVLTAGAVQASSSRSSLQLSITLVDRCDISDRGDETGVDCPADIPWLVASPATLAAFAPADTGASLLPVPLDAPEEGGRVTVIVF